MVDGGCNIPTGTRKRTLQMARQEAVVVQSATC